MALVKMTTVEEELKKNSELKKSDLEILKDWLKKQPHLPPMSDSELVLFLHSNYYRTEPTKSTIDIFFTLRTHVPELLSNRDPMGSKELRHIMKVVSFVPLSGTTPEGYKILYLKTTDPDPSRYVFADVVRLLGMVLELWLHTNAGNSPGHVAILDANGTVFGHMAQMSPTIMKKSLYYLQEALPIRLKAVHIINVLPFVDLIVSMARPFMKKELFDLLSFHSSPETLSKKISLDLLPNESGGKAGALEDLWVDEVTELEAHRAWFLEDQTRKVNENVRPGKVKNATDLFGVEGSFKKLDID